MWIDEVARAEIDDLSIEALDIGILAKYLKGYGILL